MKVIVKPLILLAFVLSTTIPLLAQDTSAVEPFIVLKIGGEISFDAETMPEVLVELYEQNRMVDAMETRKNGKFKFNLFNDHIYTIQISKDGYFTKRIEVNTSVPQDFEEIIEYPFDMQLEKLTENVASDREHLLEYPIAIITFNEKDLSFEYHKNYTKDLMKELKASSDN